MKKILLSCIILISFLSWSFQLVEWSSTNIKDADFEIQVETITPWSVKMIWGGAWETIDNVLLTVLEKLIIVFGVCAVFMMTIGAWYMIIHHGEDSFLSKWKSIFVAGILGTAVALSAWVIVKLFAYLLY